MQPSSAQIAAQYLLYQNLDCFRQVTLLLLPIKDAILAGLPVPPTDDPMGTDALQPAASAATPAGDVEMANAEQAGPSTASTSTPAAEKAEDPDAATYLPECITHTARLMESVFSNHDTCTRFIQQGGIEALLHLYKLPKLPATFGSSSASHSLLAMFRALTAHNSADIATKLQPALASHFLLTLGSAKVRS